MKNLKLLAVCCLWMVGVAAGSVGARVWFEVKGVKALDSLVLTSKSDWEGGMYDGNKIDTSSAPGDISLKSGSLGSWPGLALAPENLTTGAGAVYIPVANVMLVSQGSSRNFYKYDLSIDVWSILPDIPYATGAGSKLAFDGSDTVYLLRGGNTKSVFKYTITTGLWSSLPDLPLDSYGGSLVFSTSNSGLYVVKGNYDNRFWQYEPIGQTWALKSPLPVATNGAEGVNLVYLNGYIFYQRRGCCGGSENLYQYNVGTDGWTTRPGTTVRTQYQSGMTTDGTYLYQIEGSGTGVFKRYDVGTTTWTTLPSQYFGFATSGGMIEYADNYIYGWLGEKNMARYSIGTTTWETNHKSLPAATEIYNYGSDLIYLDGYLYYQKRGCCGGNEIMRRYDPATETWLARASTTSWPTYQAKMVGYGTKIYMFGGNGQSIFKVYDSGTNAYTELANAPGNFATAGSAIGVGNSIIYTLQGGTTAFWRYTITSNTWDVTRANLPANSGSGAGIVYVSSMNSLLVTRGASRTFWKYDIAGDVWTTMPDIPYDIGIGSKLDYDGNDTVYLLRGGNTKSIYKFSISENTWSSLADTPVETYGGSMTYNPVNGGLYVVKGNSSVIFWSLQPSIANYPTSATYIKTFDVTYADSWGGLVVGKTEPSGTGVTVDTRSSVDGFYWSDWQVVDGTTIQSPAGKRYLQTRLTIGSSQGVVTPVVNSLTINYTVESEDPINPNTVNGYANSTKSQTIDSGGTYPGSNPYFEWSGAVDAKSGAEGYYVYFGGTETADPVASGYYQTGNSYRVREKMGSGEEYYLRVRTKDRAGNISSASTLFTYVYNGVSPSESTVIDNQLDWDYGTNDGTTTSTESWANATYLYRQLITINNDVGLSMPVGYNVRLTLDTETLIGSGKMQSVGDDLRIYYWSGLVWKELSRGILDIGTTATKVNFGLENVLGVGESTTSYYVYYGNPAAVNPPRAAYIDIDAFRYFDFETGMGDVTYRDGGFVVNRNTGTGASGSTASAGVTISAVQGSAVITGGDFYSDNYPKFGYWYKSGGGNANFMFNVSGRGWAYVRVNSVSEGYTRLGDVTHTLDDTWRYAEFNLDAFLHTTWGAGNYLITDVIYGKWSNYSAGSMLIDNITIFNSGVTLPTISYSAETEREDVVDSQLSLSQDSVAGRWSGIPYLPASTESNTYGSNLIYHGGYIYYYKSGCCGGNEWFYKYNPSSRVWVSTGNTLPSSPAQQAKLVANDSDIFGIKGNGSAIFFKYTPSTNVYAPLTSAPGNFAAVGGNIAVGGSYVYGFQGNSTNFWRYSISGDVWDQTLSLPPSNLLAGAGSVYVPSINALLVAKGGSMTFWKYDIGTDSWSSLTDIPYDVGIGGRLDYDGSDSVYLSRGGNTKSMYKYAISTNTWSVLAEAPKENNGGSMAYNPANNRIYILSGNYAINFYEYEVNTNKWSSYKAAPATTHNPAMEYDGSGYIYVLRGYGQRDFWKYKISDGSWEVLSDAPYSMYYGTDLVYDGSRYLYALRGYTTKNFYQYDTQTNLWSTMPDTISEVGAGGGLAIDNGRQKIYAVRGAGTTEFWEYDIGTSVWGSKRGTPAAINNGCGLVYDGNGQYYTCQGNGGTGFYRYNVGTTNWTTMPVSPLSVSAGGNGMVTDGSKIWVLRNAGAYDFMVFNIGTTSWSVGTTASFASSYGAMAKAGNTIYALPGGYSDNFYTHILPEDNTGYAYKGTYTSRAINLGKVYSLAGLELDIIKTSNLDVVTESRTSTDGSSWSSWQLLSEERVKGSLYSYAIGSATAAYIQFRINLYSDNNYQTPVVDKATVSYYVDNDIPIGPTTILARKSVGETDTISTGSWANGINPYFLWSGQSDGDGGSGIAGYYVYFGGDSSVDPSLSEASFQADSYLEPTLTNDGNYYLKLAVKDNVGNISSGTGVAFEYKLDSVSPEKPSLVAADPRNYTAVNNFTMLWSSVDDVGELASGLLGYRYKTGAGTGVFGSDQLVIGTQLTSVPAYQDGTNTFFVKAVDNAGNESAYSEVSYYYNGSAPSPPTNLAVGVSYNTANSFAFTWDEPASYRGSIMEYRYSVNSLPSATNYTAVNTKSLVSGPYATLKGKNILYVVAVDEAGNVNYEAYASVEFVADTAAPGIPTNLEVFDNSIRATKQYKAGLTWDPPANLGTGFAGYAIYVSSTATSCSTSFSSFTLAGTTAGTTYVVADIGGTALSSQTYYMCLKAYDSTNQYSAVSSTVSILPTGKWLVPPDLTSTPTSTVKTKSAIISWTTSREANSFVKYGTSSGDYGNEVGSSTEVTSHSIGISNLSPGTKYYYKVLWSDEDGNQGISEEYTFTTNAAPLVSNVTIEDVGLYSAYIKFTLRNASKATVEYGETVAYGLSSVLTTSTAETVYTVNLKDLKEGTPYHMRIVAEDEESNKFNSDDYIFETLPVPRITDLKIQQVRGASTATIRLTWKSNTKVSSVVSLSPKGRPEMARDQIELTLVESHQMIVTDLLSDTDYEISVGGRDVAGNEAVMVTNDLTTAVDLRPPLVAGLKVEGSMTGVGDAAKAQIMAYWNTDEPGTSQVEYGEGTGSEYIYSTQEDTRLTLNHLVTVPDLKPGTVYHLRVVTKDKMGNTTRSLDNVIITPKATKAALDIVIDGLSKSFGFFSNLSQVAK